MNIDKVTRFEVIDHRKSMEGNNGRVLVISLDTTLKIVPLIQDDGRTLKIVITDNPT